MTLLSRTAEALDRVICEQAPGPSSAMSVMAMVGSELLAQAALREASAHLERVGFKAAAREIRSEAG